MEVVTGVQNLGEAVCILLHAYTFMKGMDSSVFFSVMDK